MAPIFLYQQTPYPKLIQWLRFLVLLATIIYAGWFDLAISGITSFFPDILLLSSTFGLSWLFQPMTSALIIRYPGFGISMVFDLLVINFFLTPIVTFVLSFLSEKHFLQLLIGLIVIGAGTFLGIGTLSNSLPPSSSLFSGIALSLVIFWALLHRKGQSTLLLAFPLSRSWVVFLSLCAALYSPLSNGEWAHVGAIVCMSICTYIWGITRWRLRSNVGALEGLEQRLDTTYRTFSRFLQWYVLRPFRQWFHRA